MEAHRNLILKLARFSVDCQATETDFLGRLTLLKEKGYEKNRVINSVVTARGMLCKGGSSLAVAKCGGLSNNKKN